MKPIVSIIMGSTSDLPVMEKAAKFFDEMEIPFEMNALSAHRTPDAVEAFAKGAKERGIKVIIAGAGMAAALPGVIAASTTLPVIGVPVKGSVLDGVDAVYSMLQMPPGIPVATVAINGALNAGIDALLFNRWNGDFDLQKIRLMYSPLTIYNALAPLDHFLYEILSDEPPSDEVGISQFRRMEYTVNRRNRSVSVLV